LILTCFRLNRLERTVNALIRRLGDDSVPEVSHPRAAENTRQPGIRPELDICPAEPTPAPLFVLRDVATEAGVRPPDQTSTDAPARELSHDIILKGFLTEHEALFLLSLSVTIDT
jgi:hypothetical protein